jgi:RHS repeat-associated protein
MRRLLSKTPDPSFSQLAVTFTYNVNGQRETMTDVSGTTVYGYDNRNRLSSKQTPFGTLSYTYNDAGSLQTTRSSNANGVSIDYGYDALNRLSSVKDNNLTSLNGGLTNYTYDDVGNLQSYQYPNGVTTSYAYNSLNRLTTMTVGTQASSLASYSYTLGAAGNRTAVTELGGRTLTYTYDDLYRLTNESIAADPHGVNGSVSYGYDAVGNRLNRTSTVAAVPAQASTYDANDRLTSDSYDNNGNTTASSGNGYTYDFENHLTSLNNGAVTYVYDGDGNRVAKTVGGVTTNCLVDTNNPTGYAQVVDELQSGSVVKSFTYGHDLISQRIGSSNLSFYQYDGHASVRLLTNATGAISDAYDYDAFGNLIYRIGTTPNDYLYSGEQYDASLGFYYLRARYMNPSSGRFWTMDSFEGNNADPASLHKYVYVHNKPVNAVDPSGHFIGSIIGEINALSWRCVMFTWQYAGLFKALQLTLTAVHLYELATNEEYAYNFLSSMNPYDAATLMATDLASFTGVAGRGPGLPPVQFPNRYPEDIPGPAKVGRLLQEDGKWFVSLPGEARRTASGRYIFVSMEGRIYVAKQPGAAGVVVGHVDISNGAPVDYAGEIFFSGRTNRGTLRGWSNASGHYQPGAEYAGQAGLPLEYFNPANFDTSPQRGIPLIDLGN